MNAADSNQAVIITDENKKQSSTQLTARPANNNITKMTNTPFLDNIIYFYIRAIILCNTHTHTQTASKLQPKTANNK